MTEKKYLTLLTSYLPLGYSRIKLLYDYFSSFEKIWKSTNKDLIALGVSERLVLGFEKYKKDLSKTQFFENLKKHDINFVTYQDETFPKNLKNITDFPLVLYYKGNLNFQDDKAVAVVGSRKMSAYGEKTTQLFVEKLVGKEYIIVSGLARGVDTKAHQTTLDFGGRTIAVLACGLDRVYPPENLSLARKITQKGIIFSEYSPGVYVQPYFFTQRNRIISGLSKGVLVVEGEKKSGTLLTASQAANQGISVYAIPGRVDSPLSGASHFLIRAGATLISTPEELMSDLEKDFRV